MMTEGGWYDPPIEILLSLFLLQVSDPAVLKEQISRQSQRQRQSESDSEESTIGW